MDNLNPGIRRTVAWLRERGYNTTDSGDGKTHDFECDMPVPYVHIKVRPEHLVGTAQVLRNELEAAGVKLEPINEEGTAKAIEASYNPAQEYGYVTLWNVTDAILFPGEEG